MPRTLTVCEQSISNKKEKWGLQNPSRWEIAKQCHDKKSYNISSPTRNFCGISTEKLRLNFRRFKRIFPNTN